MSNFFGVFLEGFGEDFAMPRKNPLPTREAEVCVRLRRYRKLTKLSQVVFAREIGLDSTTLASYEHARAPLKSGVAGKIIASYGLNPGWLAEGKGRPFVDIPPSMHCEIMMRLSSTPEALFSQVFQEMITGEEGQKLSAVFSQPISEKKETIEVSADSQGRLFAWDWLQGEMLLWIAAVPGSKINHFLNKVICHAEDLLETYPVDIREDVSARLREIVELRQRRKLLPHKPDKFRAECGEINQALLDNGKESAIISIMNSQFGSLWNELRSRLITATKDRGTKSELARNFKVSRQAVGEWLSGASSPSAETALGLLKWVAESENAKKEAPGRVVTTTKGKTRKRRSDHETPNSGPP